LSPASGLHAQRERESQADFMLSSGPDVGLGLMTLGSRPEPEPGVGRSASSTTQVPR